MSARRAYAKGERVLVDPGVFVASPACRTPTVVCDVLETSVEQAAQVYVCRIDTHDMLYVFKDRVLP